MICSLAKGAGSSFSSLQEESTSNSRTGKGNNFLMIAFSHYRVKE